MKAGILVECGRQGLEDVLCRRICELLGGHIGRAFEVDIVPMDNKERLILECGAAAARLLDEGCDHVVILWDERPAWPKVGARLCWHRDRDDVLASLRKAGVAGPSVQLVCVEREFESWLLHDERMLSCVLSTAEHPIRVRPQQNPHRMPNPKGAMMRLFRQHRGWRYVDVQYARAFARCLPDLARLRGCATFRRFAEKVTGRAVWA
jgi:hypothetical protein